MNPPFQKTRLAPTPSGYLHIGNVVSFLITSSLARNHGARILLRIDDLDERRTRIKFIQDIFDTLEFLEIPYDEGPRTVAEHQQQFSQRHRMDQYEELLQNLKENDQAFGCDCSRKNLRQNHPKGWYTGNCLQRHLDLQGKNISWRLDTRTRGLRQLRTYPDSIKPCHLPQSMNYFVIRKKDSDPSYQLTSVADDSYFGVDLVVRGEDLWDSSCAQIHLSAHLGGDPLSQVTFFHHPLVKDGEQKLSKSEGALAIKTLRENGLSKEEVYLLAARQLGLKGPIHSLTAFQASFMDKLKGNHFNHHNPEC